jgi:hypothetical protein
VSASRMDARVEQTSLDPVRVGRKVTKRRRPSRSGEVVGNGRALPRSGRARSGVSSATDSPAQPTLRAHPARRRPRPARRPPRRPVPKRLRPVPRRRHDDFLLRGDPLDSAAGSLSGTKTDTSSHSTGPPHAPQSRRSTPRQVEVTTAPVETVAAPLAEPRPTPLRVDTVTATGSGAAEALSVPLRRRASPSRWRSRSTKRPLRARTSQSRALPRRSRPGPRRSERYPRRR